MTDKIRAEVRYVRLPVFELLTGYTEKAVRRKIQEGVWIEGHEYKKAPDGHILIDLRGFELWAEHNRQVA